MKMIILKICSCDEDEDDSYGVQSFDRNFGRSLMAGYSDHYLSDFALHGTSDKNFLEKVQRDLSISVQVNISTGFQLKVF